VQLFERLQQIGGVVEATRVARSRRATLTSLPTNRAAMVETATALLSAPSTLSDPNPVS
jgi:hypothetical protein